MSPYMPICLGLLLLTGVLAAPADFAEKDQPLSRVRRFTCDALSFSLGGVSVNHSACALHCLKKGYKGGFCQDNGICRCRD